MIYSERQAMFFATFAILIGLGVGSYGTYKYYKQQDENHRLYHQSRLKLDAYTNMLQVLQLNNALLAHHQGKRDEERKKLEDMLDDTVIRLEETFPKLKDKKLRAEMTSNIQIIKRYRKLYPYKSRGQAAVDKALNTMSSASALPPTD